MKIMNKILNKILLSVLYVWLHVSYGETILCSCTNPEESFKKCLYSCYGET